MRAPSRRITILAPLAGAFLLLTASKGAAHPPRPVHTAMPSDSADVASVVRAFHEALEEGDSATVRDLLADEVTVAEGGGVESRSDYLAHHLPADMAYAAAVHRELRSMDVTVMGNVAWTVSTSRSSGTYRDREVNSVGAELMLLVRSDDRWRIRAIHWSSGRAR